MPEGAGFMHCVQDKIAGARLLVCGWSEGIVGDDWVGQKRMWYINCGVNTGNKAEGRRRGAKDKVNMQMPHRYCVSASYWFDWDPKLEMLHRARRAYRKICKATTRARNGGYAYLFIGRAGESLAHRDS